MRRLFFEALESRNLLSASVVPNLDLNNDGDVTALDALVGIDAMNNAGGSYRLRFEDGEIADFNGNGWRDPGDVIAVINDLNENGPHKVVYNADLAVTLDYNDVEDVVVEPGEKVLALSVDISSNDETTFLAGFQLTPVVDYAVLVCDNIIVAEAKNGVFDVSASPIELSPPAPRSFQVFVTAPSQVGGYLFSVEDVKIGTFPGATSVVTTTGLENRGVVTVREDPIPQYTFINVKSAGPGGRSLIGDVRWGHDWTSDTFSIEIVIAGPNLHGDFPVFAPFGSMFLQSANSVYHADLAFASWNGEELHERFEFTMPIKLGQVYQIRSDLFFRSELDGAEFRLLLKDQTGQLISVSGPAPFNW